jgi:hypothetical protein
MREEPEKKEALPGSLSLLWAMCTAVTRFSRGCREGWLGNRGEEQWLATQGGMETGAGRPLRLVQGGKETGTNKVEKEEK